MPTGRTTAPGTGVRRTHDPCLQLGFAAPQPIVPPPRRWTVADVLHARVRTAATAPRSGRTSQVDRIRYGQKDVEPPRPLDLPARVGFPGPRSAVGAHPPAGL